MMPAQAPTEDRTARGRPVTPARRHVADMPGKYLSITSYRRDGTGVATPVWFVEEGGRLLVMTAADSGKVKRSPVRNAFVTAAPCSARGPASGRGDRGPRRDPTAERGGPRHATHRTQVPVRPALREADPGTAGSVPSGTPRPGRGDQSRSRRLRAPTAITRMSAPAFTLPERAQRVFDPVAPTPRSHTLGRGDEVVGPGERSRVAGERVAGAAAVRPCSRASTRAAAGRR